MAHHLKALPPRWALLAVLLVASCDTSPFEEVDAAVLDLGITVDQIIAPDFARADAGKAGLVGEPCTPGSDGSCGGLASCLDVGHGIGICAIPDCTKEDPQTAQREDSCPEETACAEISVAKDLGYEQMNFCLRTCKPDRGKRPCASRHPALACAPATILLTGYHEICAVPACKGDLDCIFGNPLEPDAWCQSETGLCFVKGKVDADVGSPCQTSRDCGPSQFCLREERNEGKVRIHGGYCTIVGCEYGGPWSCPKGSSCLQLGASDAISICLAVGCDPGAPEDRDGCRDQAPAGQYSCTHLQDQDVCWVQP